MGWTAMIKILTNKTLICLFLLATFFFIAPKTVFAADANSQNATADSGAKKVIENKSNQEIAYYEDKDQKQYSASFWDAYRRNAGEDVTSTKGRAAFQFTDLMSSSTYMAGAGAAAGTFLPGVGTAAGAAIGAGVGAAGYIIDWAFNTTDQYTWKDPMGNTFKFHVDSGGEAVYVDGASQINGCEVLPAKLYKYRECMFCSLFQVIYVASDDITALSLNNLSEGFAVVIAIGLAIFIAIQTLGHVSSLTKQDAPKFLDTLIRQTFKFFIAFLLLHFHRQLLDYILLPILNTGLVMGRNFLFSNGDDLCAIIPLDKIDVAAYGNELYSNLVCYITTIQREIGFMQAIGSSLLCIGGNSMLQLADFGDGFQMAVVGFILAAFGFLLSIAFAFYLLDAVVQLGIVGALLPFLIASWPFKVTSKYANTGFQMLLNSAFIFVFMGLVVSVNLRLVGASIGETSKVSLAEQLKEVNPNFKEDSIDKATGALKVTNDDDYINMGGLSALYVAINNGNFKKLTELTDISGLDFLIMLFCCIFGFKFTTQAQSLADKMASGSVSGISPSIATMGGSAALGMAKKATQSTREAAEAKVKQGIGNIYRGGKSRIKSLFSRNRSGGTAGTGFSKPKTPTVFNQGGPRANAPSPSRPYGSDTSKPTPVNFEQRTSIETPRNLEERMQLENQLGNEFDNTELGRSFAKTAQAASNKKDLKSIRKQKAKVKNAYVKARMAGQNQEEALKSAQEFSALSMGGNAAEMTPNEASEIIAQTQERKNPPKNLGKNNGSKKGNNRISRKAKKHGGRRR